MSSLVTTVKPMTWPSQQDLGQLGRVALVTVAGRPAQSRGCKVPFSNGAAACVSQPCQIDGEANPALAIKQQRLPGSSVPLETSVSAKRSQQVFCYA